MGECDLAGLFEDDEHRNPVFSGRFHTDLGAVQFCQPMTKASKSLRESGKPCSVVMGSIVVVCYANASVNPGFVNGEAALGNL